MQLTPLYLAFHQMVTKPYKSLPLYEVSPWKCHSSPFFQCYSMPLLLFIQNNVFIAQIVSQLKSLTFPNIILLKPYLFIMSFSSSKSLLFIHLFIVVSLHITFQALCINCLLKKSKHIDQPLSSDPRSQLCSGFHVFPLLDFVPLVLLSPTF